MRPTVSAVVVTLNEAAQVAECLHRLAWCDERILVDMHSADATREVARPLATTVLLHEPIAHMEFARNAGIDAATGDWILVVDADELIPEALATGLRQATAATDAAGLWLPRMNYWFGRPMPHFGDFPDYQLRCFRRGLGRYPDRLHAAPEVQGRLDFLPATGGAWIEHSRRNSSMSDLVRKWDTYASKEAAMALADGRPFGGPVAALWAGLSAFRFRYVKRRAYRDGTAGLILSVLFAFYRFEVEAKKWEATGYGTGFDGRAARLSSLPRLGASLVGHALSALTRRGGPGAARG